MVLFTAIWSYKHQHVALSRCVTIVFLLNQELELRRRQDLIAGFSRVLEKHGLRSTVTDFFDPHVMHPLLTLCVSDPWVALPIRINCRHRVKDVESCKCSILTLVLRYPQNQINQEGKLDLDIAWVHEVSKRQNSVTIKYVKINSIV